MSFRKINIISLLFTPAFFLIIVFIITGFIAPFSLSAENTGLKKKNQGQYIIRKIHTDNNKGVTLGVAIRRVLQIKKNQRFQTEKELALFCKDREVVLLNKRVLDKAYITYTLNQQNDGTVDVEIYVTTTDSGHFVLLPYANYDSNDGLLISGRFRDYNLFGTMETLSLNINYRLNENNESEFNLNASYPIYFSLGPQILCLKLDETVYLNGDADEYDDPYFNNATVGLSTSFDTGWKIDGKNSLGYNVGLSFSFNTSLDSNDDLSGDRSATPLSLSNSIGFGRIDWVENIRDGYFVSLGNSTSYDIYNEDWGSKIKTSFIFHKEFYPFSFSSRILFSINPFTKDSIDQGGTIRGVVNSDIQSLGALTINTNLLVKTFKLGVFEMHAGFFIDACFLIMIDDESPDKETDHWGAGIEAVMFTSLSKSLFFRFSLGFNVRKIYETYSFEPAANREISAGLGFFF